MERHDTSLIRFISGRRPITVLAAITISVLSLGTPASAQTRSSRDTATAYGARLNAKGEPANLNPNRLNSRLNTRLETRLSLRVERYRPDNASDPAAAFATPPTDNARVGTETTLSPLSTASPSSASQAYEGSPPTSPAQTDEGTRPR